MGATQNLINTDGIEKLQTLTKSATTCLMTTSLQNRPLSTRPMSTLQVDDDGNFWFFSQKTSQKNSELRENPEIQLFYTNMSSSEYLTVYGHASISRNEAKIEELWSPISKAWFSRGKEDPELTVLKVTPLEAYYWDTKHNKMVQLVKILAGSIIGRPLDDGIEGRITL